MIEILYIYIISPHELCNNQVLQRFHSDVLISIDVSVGGRGGGRAGGKSGFVGKRKRSPTRDEPSKKQDTNETDN